MQLTSITAINILTMCTVLYLRTVCYKQRRRMYAMCVPIFRRWCQLIVNLSIINTVLIHIARQNQVMPVLETRFVAAFHYGVYPLKYVFSGVEYHSDIGT